MTNPASRVIIYLAFAGVAHLVERDLAKVEVASSSLVARSRKAPSEKMVLSFFADSPANSLPRPARSALNQEVRQGSCEWRQPFVGCREASSSLVARSKNITPGGVFLREPRRSPSPAPKRIPHPTGWGILFGMCRSTGELAASTCAKRAKSGGETGHRRSQRERNAAAVNVRC